MTAEEKLRNYVSAELDGGSHANLTSDSSLIDRLDSLAIMETVAFIESEFNIRVEDDEVVPSNFATLGVLAAYVEAKLGA